MRAFASLGLMMFLGLAGCSGLVRGFVNTQPRVELNQSDFADPGAIVKGDAVAYEPGEASPGADIDPDLARFAPVIVQGVESTDTKAPRYDPGDDAIGSPHVTAQSESVRIDTSKPRLYARVEHATVGHTQLKQLVYTFWYPSHPVGSIETGAVDGGVLRVTLDAAAQPAVFEYTQPCGCFHGVFVSDAIERDAAAQFTPIPPERMYAVEPPLTGEDDWVVRDVVALVPNGRITLYISAGKHACEAIGDEPPDPGAPGISAHLTYELVPYDALDHVPNDAGGRASIFGDNGLVLGARRRSEQFLLGDLDHAGWPRRLDLMLIHWDADQWTDPTLLETHLRLPTSIVESDAPLLTAASAAPDTPTPSVAPAPTPEAAQTDGRRLVLFTNGHCLGCQQTKKYMADSRNVQSALKGWDCQVVDTLTPQGELLAAEARISSVPVLVGYNDGHEIFRADDIDSPEKIAAVIEEHTNNTPRTRASVAAGS